VGDEITAKVDESTRRATAANHTATHLLQAALRSILGDHIKQSGSLVSPDRLRFDFTHFAKVDPQVLRQVEKIVNGLIRDNLPVTSQEMALTEAMATGATAVFDERYGERVRVLAIGGVSRELCGGTHVKQTGNIGTFKIIHEAAIAAGVRRIEALTAQAAIDHLLAGEDNLNHVSGLLKTPPSQVGEKLEKLLHDHRELERKIGELQEKLTARDSSELVRQARVLNGVTILSLKMPGLGPKELRTLGDQLRRHLSSGIILLGSEGQGKANLLCLVSPDLTDRFSAADLVCRLAPLVGGSGGGRKDLAQAGGPNPAGLEAALARLSSLVGG
jgi:alanyl-tRNA synthetase